MLKNKLYVLFYDILGNWLDVSKNFLPNSNSIQNIVCIKSIVNSNHSKALVSLINLDGEMKSFIFNIDNKKISDIHLNQYFSKDNACKRNYYGLNLFYLKSNEEYINSCIDLQENLLIEFYDKNFNLYNYKNIDFGYSILYSNCTQKYFFFSNEEPFKLLEGDDEELEEIKKMQILKIV